MSKVEEPTITKISTGKVDAAQMQYGTTNAMGDTTRPIFQSTRLLVAGHAKIIDDFLYGFPCNV
eukprot:2360103-Amphidinium_carterae.1